MCIHKYRILLKFKDTLNEIDCCLPSPNSAVHMLINTIRIVSAHIFTKIFLFFYLYK